MDDFVELHWPLLLQSGFREVKTCYKSGGNGVAFCRCVFSLALREWSARTSGKGVVRKNVVGFVQETASLLAFFDEKRTLG